jgi:hypothetical protein
MQELRSVIVALAISFALVSGVVVLAAGNPADEKDLLTVEETVGAVLDRRADGFGYRWNLYRQANPNARKAVLSLLADDRARFYRQAALRVLGYIGEDGDVSLIERAMLGSFTGLLTDSQQSDLRAFCDCMGLLAGRGSTSAKKLLDDMTTLDYWRRCGFKIRRPSAEIGSLPGYEHEHEGLVLAFSGYSLCNNADLTERAEKVLASIDNAGVKTYMTGCIGAESLAGHAAGIHERENQPIAAEERGGLRANYRALPGLLGSTPTPEDREYLRRTIDEALKAYEEIKAAVVGGDGSEAAARLLDNGKLIDPRKLVQLRAEFVKDAAREKEVFHAMAKYTIEPTNFEVTRTTVFDLRRYDAKADIDATKQEGDATVTFRLGGSVDVGDQFLRQQKGNLTVADDGTLIVVMKKIDGKWYWNPFGW